jgi:predicted dehydrogenase
MNRREFLSRTQTTGLSAAAGLTLLGNAASVRATPANERIVLAVVGVRGRGSDLSRGFCQRGDCRIAYVCDVDSRLFASRAKMVAEAQGGKAPQCVQDFRKALDDRSVDAVIVATPDHWHVPAALWSCQAGKDVYVEKPLSHNAWEGRRLVQAARKYRRVVQVGTQNRSAAYNLAAKKYIAEGKLGRVHFCRIYNQKEWGNFTLAPEGDPPQGFDWDMWNGPAPECRYNAAYIDNWHHLWRYSGGDMANDASHQIDLARWVLGLEHPTSVYSMGGRWDSTGAAETPDTQTTIWEFPGMMVNFELTLYTPYMLKISPLIRQATDKYPYWPQCATRIEVYGSEGLMYLGRHGGGWQVFTRPKLQEGVLKDQCKGKFPDPEHKQNFVECIRSRQRPNADVEEGHRSALWIHYGNISYRLGGQKLTIDPKTDEIVDNPAAMQLFRRKAYRKPWSIGDEA